MAGRFQSEPATDVGPHAFKPRRVRDRFKKDGECAACFVDKALHPIEWWVPARPLGYSGPRHLWIWCPMCGWELIAGGRWLGQEVATGREGYRCSQCGHVTVWDFDTPAPYIVEGNVPPKVEA